MLCNAKEGRHRVMSAFFFILLTNTKYGWMLFGYAVVEVLH